MPLLRVRLLEALLALVNYTLAVVLQSRQVVYSRLHLAKGQVLW